MVHSTVVVTLYPHANVCTVPCMCVCVFGAYLLFFVLFVRARRCTVVVNYLAVRGVYPHLHGGISYTSTEYETVGEYPGRPMTPWQIVLGRTLVASNPTVMAIDGSWYYLFL